MPHQDQPHAPDAEAPEEVREALTPVGGEESDDERAGEAGDALRRYEKAQEWAHGEAPD
ncbi:hypothetical protein LHJ74_17095 [Streptomyces sp. N2-109]|uniref:Uncharacterized protein n=1 Tax=Streptomyces gossypii TaxID=2883101 RepID=A0ABT2JWG3_9ACTN|nr:hypothetical protein [Streptomyces gossypii]MCT2591594.1 hypothetical protein [Streptomyces gossypii]